MTGADGVLGQQHVTRTQRELLAVGGSRRHLSTRLVAGAIGGLIGIKRQYAAYMVVRNWAAPLMTAPFALVSLLERLGVSEDLLLIPSLAALVFSLRFSYLIVRRTLGVEIDVAIAFVALDVFVSLAVVKIVGKLTGIDPFG